MRGAQSIQSLRTADQKRSDGFSVSCCSIDLTAHTHMHTANIDKGTDTHPHILYHTSAHSVKITSLINVIKLLWAIKSII